jgi:hypothetical protein
MSRSFVLSETSLSLVFFTPAKKKLGAKEDEFN